MNIDTPHITLEQWRALVAVVDAGGYAQAADALHKSQSAITYAVQKIESLLGVRAFEIEGRKAVLTPTGQLLYRRALALLADAGELERAARKLSAGWEAQIGVAVEILYPTWLLFDCLAAFARESPHTRIEVIESVLGGTAEALLTGQADLAISPRVPPGFHATPLMRLRAVAVAHPRHPLHQLGRQLSMGDLHGHRHLTVRDSGTTRDQRAITVEVEQRWIVSNMSTAIEAACAGHGFAWFPEERIRDELQRGALKPLPLQGGEERFVELYLILADAEFAGPGVRRLGEIIDEKTRASCKQRKTALSTGAATSG